MAERRVWRAPMALAGICAAATVIAFFMPWAHVEVRDPSAKLSKAAKELGLGRVELSIRQGGRTVQGVLPSLTDLPDQVRGVDIPRLANQRDALLAMAMVELLTGARHDLDRKSYAVYAVPGLALLAAVLLALLPSRAAALTVAVLCAGVVLAGGWKLTTTETSSALAAVTIGAGLWLSLGAYAGLAAAAAWQAQHGGRA